MTPVRVLERLAAMDRGEMHARSRALLRRQAARIAFSMRRPRWRREALAGALRADDAVVGDAVALLRRRDWAGAHERLMHAFATRPTGFVLDAGNRTSRIAAVVAAFPSAMGDARSAADRIVEGRFDLLGYKDLSFAAPDGTGVDWHLDPVHGVRAARGYWSTIPYLQPECGDHKIIWELNRHQYWLALGRAYVLTGDARYRARFIADADSWLAANPPLDGINWASMLELGFRAISWLWALHLFSLSSALDDATERERGETAWTVDLLLGLDRQLALVEANLSRYFSPNTHLLGEALALYVAGRTLPGFVRARTWETIGRSVLLQEIAAQINGDGGHAEGSTHYHRYALDFYLLALTIARRTGDAAADAFAHAAERLARVARTFADDNGRFPPIGDEDGGALFPICGRDVADVSDSLQIAATLLGVPELAAGAPAEEAVWMTGTSDRRPRAPWRSAALAHTGYHVSRSGRGDLLIVDAGPHGFLNGGHAHADALSLTLSVRARALLIDPGTGCYTIDPAVRDCFRSTAMHNTVTIDGRPQAMPDGPFHWRTKAHARAHDWRAMGEFDYFEGSHDGYAPLVHHRAILSRPGCWLVVDRLLGDGAHHAEVHWHFAPEWRVARGGPASIRADRDDGGPIWLLSTGTAARRVDLVRGGDDPSIGWCAPVYGRLAATAAVRHSLRGQAPIYAVTAIVDTAEAPSIALLPVTGEASAHDIGFRIATAVSAEVVLFAWTDERPSAVAGPRPIRRAGGVETDARVLCWREAAGDDGTPAVMIDGTFARTVFGGANDCSSPGATALQATGVV